MKYTEYTDEQIQEIKCQRDRRKRQQITVIVFILGVLFALVGILACCCWWITSARNGRRKPRNRMQQVLTRSKPCHLFTDSLRKIPCPEGAFHDKMIS